MILSLLTTLLLMIAPVQDATVRDDAGHALVKLWKTYYTAQDKDRPDDALNALEAIKAEAKKRREAWDYYDACSLAADVTARKNWKQREVAQQKFVQEIDAYAEPVMLFYHKILRGDSQGALDILNSSGDVLAAGCNREFYRHDYAISSPAYGEALLQFLTNDREYALWSLFLHSDAPSMRAPARKEFAGTYPYGAFIEFSDIPYSDSDALEQYAKRYDGKAVALIARDALLQATFDRLTRTEGRQQDYLDLDAACKRLQADRKRFLGSEKIIADCCIHCKELSEILNDSFADCNVKDGTLYVRLRNLPKADVVITRDGARVYASSLKNTVRSFYVPDTLTLRLPALNDGDYRVECSCGKVTSSCNYDKHTLSIALKRDNGGYAAYVADHKTGEPVKKCEIRLLDNAGKVLMSSPLTFDGYTYLPSGMQSKVGENLRGRYSLQAHIAGSSSRLSKAARLPSAYTESSAESAAAQNCLVLVDRRAFNPGETVHFKAILYNGTYEYTTAPEGINLKARLIDPQGNAVSECSLRTNSFGSASGEFVLPKLERNGDCNIEILKGKNSIGGNWIRVDEFVLPSFTLEFEKNDAMLFPGDCCTVRGIVTAYSGHSLSGANAQYEVRRYSDSVCSGPLEISSDGRFSFDVKTLAENDWGDWYTVSVKVTDATGETLEFNTSLHTTRDPGLSVSLTNAARGHFSTPESSSARYGGSIVSDPTAKLQFSTNSNARRESLQISYRLLKDGKKVAYGTLSEPGTAELNLAGLASGLYKLEADAVAKDDNLREHASHFEMNLIKASDEDESLDMDVTSFFKEVSGDAPALQIGATCGPVWAVVELHGDGNVFLGKRLVYLTGKKGAKGSLTTVRFPLDGVTASKLAVRALFFRDGECFQYTTREVDNAAARQRLPLEFTRFTDTSAPRARCFFQLKTSPASECAVSVFDVSTETICANIWEEIFPYRRQLGSATFTYSCGCDGREYPYLVKNGAVLMATKSAMSSRSVQMVNEEMATADFVVEMDEAAPVAMAAGAAAPDPAVAVREDFAASLYWNPALRPDENGNADIEFDAADKLSRFAVQVFAHDKSMLNAVIRREMTVTIPVKVSVVQPQVLREGDVYVARMSMRNSSENPVTGTATLQFFDGEDYRGSVPAGGSRATVSIEPGGVQEFSCEYRVPQGVKTLGILASFSAGTGCSDAMFVTTPVLEGTQEILESHSAVLLSGADRAALERSLRSQFTNVDGSLATMSEVSIRQMLAEALQVRIKNRGDDVVSLTSALYSAHLASALGCTSSLDEAPAELWAKVAACQNSDGGFGWFEGMNSSPVITAFVLERLSSMGLKTVDGIKVTDAVLYLDAVQFGSKSLPWWCGWLQLEQYLHVRAIWAAVPFSKTGIDSKRWKEFRKNTDEALTPTKDRGLQGQILAKARRCRTLKALLGTSEGGALASAWGLKTGKMSRSLSEDMESLRQYAVAHKSGGWYYPNAVMPYRGLLGSELYAHSELCSLLDEWDGGHDIAEGIRLWIMLQKETQQWGSDPSYFEALDAVYHGSEATLDTRVLVLEASVRRPFEAVKASGNGFSVHTVWQVQSAGETKWSDVVVGQVLKVGDKVRAEYHIWNEENRSFVKLTAPRPASMRPVNQLSGHVGWWCSPLRVSGGSSFTPQGYRCVRAGVSEYFFDTYPEEKTVFSEEFFVAQEGSFRTPAAVIESLYASHYRACDGGRSAIVSK